MTTDFNPFFYYVKFKGSGKLYTLNDYKNMLCKQWKEIYIEIILNKRCNRDYWII
jgi:hypothetical protein